MPDNRAPICAPFSFWNFSAAMASGGPSKRASTITGIQLLMSVPLPGLRLGARATAQPCQRPRSAFRAGRLIERRTQPLGELDRVVVRPEVHEDQPRLFGQHVAVN